MDAGSSHVHVFSLHRCWGKGFYGQLGDEQYEARGKYPGEMGVGLNTVNLGTQATALLLGAGSDHTCAILGDGSLKVWWCIVVDPMSDCDTEQSCETNPRVFGQQFRCSRGIFPRSCAPRTDS